ncbi:5-formyltetrahydrofolate cyclo-ligase [Streptomyces sp. ICBB 8177]|uniref:5-formyltetrahydrofolate cyclo-ligase n=1 Tax=Streptomyces sp. ICBB 8177 TaxID=563922 RepID=UPI001F53E486|nr:5-formyltetrahydrofolate cyclo-ligase [Streptomyces sp. ICBB 8177]
MKGIGDTDGIGGANGKAALRARLLAARRTLAAGEREEAARALARHAAALPELAGTGTVAGYVSVGGEPGTRELLETLRERGVRVLLPVLRDDNDLDWARYEGPGSLVAGPRGLLEPFGPRLGRRAVLAAGTVLLPGVAVDASGTRLGRGGGSYDRVLERLALAGAHPVLMVLLYAHEVVAAVPREPHDHPVHAVLTPEGVRRFAAPTA